MIVLEYYNVTLMSIKICIVSSHREDMVVRRTALVPPAVRSSRQGLTVRRGLTRPGIRHRRAILARLTHGHRSLRTR